MIDILIKGGFVMLPLLACSIITVAVLIDRWIAFQQNAKVDSRSLRANIMRLVEEDRVDEAIALSRNTPGPVSAVMLAGLNTYQKYRALNESGDSLRLMVGDAMNDYSLHATSAVEKRLGVLTTVGNAAPLFGMTGTVTGMIVSFHGMAASGGVDSALAATGISEALITTAAGLLVALMAVLPFQWFNSRANEIDLEIQEGISELIDLITIRSRQAVR